ncbi:MAG: class II aldolase [Candidatus Marinimicrobia bacterium]|nr:class II aldolase [Candidatus Neomarinimicrobiota bacterium]
MPDQATLETTRKELLEMSLELGDPQNRLVILGEGNTSAKVDEKTFLVKASGSQLSNLRPEQLVQVRFNSILPILDQNLNDDQTEKVLMESRVDSEQPKPSVETTFHAWLLSQDGVNFVGHTHPVEVNKILCSDKANLFADHRMFPDEIVCTGPKSLLIDYVDPGTILATTIRDGWQQFVAANGYTPKVILVKNHGFIAVGKSRESVMITTKMSVKAAEIFNGAMANGKAVFMSDENVLRIASRQDEKYRQKQLNIS